MKKSFILSKIILLTSLSVSAFAVNTSIKAHISNINAISDEIVYNTDGSKLSHLYWRLEDVKLLGITGSVSVSERIIINADYKKNMDNPKSTMDDYDWISGYTTSAAGYTHWSHHEDTSVEDVTKFDINMQVGLLPTNAGIVYGVLGYKKDTFKWIAKGGFYEYSTNNFQRAYINDDTKVISYNQYIESFYLGAGIVNNSFQNMKFDLNFKYATGVSINGEDTHHLRSGTINGQNYDGLYFEDFCDDATMLEFSLSAAYELPNNISLYLSYVYTDFDIAKGYTKTTYMGTSQTSSSSNGTAGASHESKLYSLGIKYDF